MGAAPPSQGMACPWPGLQSCPVSPVSVQDINISLWRLPEKVKFDRSVFMNQGEWELLGVLTQFQEFSIESSDSYAEMKFYVSGAHHGRLHEAYGEEPP